MNHFFIEERQISRDGVIIDDPSAVNHISNVLRLHPGDQITVSTGDSRREYLCRIEKISREEVLVRVEDISEPARELPVEITLYQGLPKGDKMEWIIQKAVELGAARVVPVAMKRSIVKLDRKKEQKKTARWNEIAKSAAAQSKRGRIPSVSGLMTFEEALKDSKSLDLLLVPYEDARGMEEARRIVRDLKGMKRIGICIGPEGGFEPYEVEAAREAGARIMTLGHRILRTETAGMMLLSVLSFALEEDVR